MKRIQISRAKSFVKRLMKICFQDKTPARRTRLLNEAIDFFDLIDGYEDYHRNRQEPEQYLSWDQKGLICDTFDEYFYEQFFEWSYHKKGYQREEYQHDHKNRFLEDLRCIVRLAVNVVCPEQDVPGVIGFTAGELRQMYPKGIPAWLNKGYGDDEVGYTKISELPEDAVLAI